MNVRHIRTLSLAILLSTPVMYAFAAGKPEVTHQTIQYIDRALSINIQWQSENPVTRIRVTAGTGQKDIAIDEYDNRRNPYGYSGETSVVVPVDPTLYSESIPYQIQLEDDLRLRSEQYYGQARIPSIAPPILAGPPGMPGTPGMIPVLPSTQNDDNWGKDNIRAGRGEMRAQDGKPSDVVDMMLKVVDRFDTPPSLEPIVVNVLGPENVTFTSRASDDKGLKEIAFRVYDGVGNKVGEQILNNLGKKWEGSTQPIAITIGGSLRVVAQAIDTAGNTSKEVTALFVMKGQGGGSPPPQEQPAPGGTNQAAPGAVLPQNQPVQQPAAITPVPVQQPQETAPAPQQAAPIAQEQQPPVVPQQQPQTPVQQPQEAAPQQAVPVAQEQKPPVQQTPPAQPVAEGQSNPGP